MNVATLYEKIRLLKGLFTGDVTAAVPSFIVVEITRRCNMRCSGCSYHSPYVGMRPLIGDQKIKDISLDMFLKLCNELKAMGTRSMNILGEGEPFLHPRLVELISSAKKAGFYVMLLTNGTLLDKSIIKSLIDSRLDALRITLWASSPEEFKQNYPGSNPNNFKRIVDGLKLLSYLKGEQNIKLPSISLHQPINRYNFQKIDAMIDLAHTTGCNIMSFAPVVKWGGESASFCLSPEEERFVCRSLIHAKKQLNSLSLEHKIDQVLLRYRMGEAVWKRLPCFIVWNHTQIKVDGTVLSCGRCDLPMGNLKENSFYEIWNGSAYRTLRRQTLTRQGLTCMGNDCNCNYCCHLEANIHYHRLFKWLSPFFVKKRGDKKRGITMLDAEN